MSLLPPEYAGKNAVLTFREDPAGWQQHLSGLDKVLRDISYKDFNGAYKVEVKGPKDVVNFYFVYNENTPVNEECLRLGAKALGFFLIIFPDFKPEIIKVFPKNKSDKSYLSYTDKGIKISSEAIADASTNPHFVTAAWLHEFIHVRKDYNEEQNAANETEPLLIEFVFPFILGKRPRDFFSNLENPQRDDKYRPAWEKAKKLILDFFNLPEGTTYQELVASLEETPKNQLLDFLKQSLK